MKNMIFNRLTDPLSRFLKSSVKTSTKTNLSEIESSKLRRSVIDSQGIRWGELCIRSVLALCAFISVITTLVIIIVLAKESFSFFQNVSPIEFFFGTRWVPLFEPSSFGVLPLVWGTLVVTFGAALIAIPVGLASAIYLSEYASNNVRKFVKPLLELLAGIPTVVYGYFALTFVTPILKNVFPEIHVFNALSGAIVVGIMILPLIATLSDNALRAVPGSLRQGAYALGATSFEVTSSVVVPAGLSGVMASFLIAISRAIGETMAVTLAVGATPNLSFTFLESIQTMTAYIVQVSLGDTPAGGVAYQTLFAVAGFLFVMTLILNVISQWVLNRYREAYDS